LETSDQGAVTELRRDLERQGESLVVVGSPGLYSVHVHTDDAEAAVVAAERAGTTRDVSVVDLRKQVRACLAGQARAVRVGERHACALVAVADGAGLARAFASLGAVVVEGAPAAGPTAREIGRAIAAAPSDDVVVLPNDAAILPSATDAAAAADKRASVVPTVSIPAGLAAATAFNAFDSLQDNERSMGKAAEHVRSAELVRSEVDRWLVVVDGRTVATELSLPETATVVVDRIVDEDAELLTVVVGDDAAPDEVQEVLEALRRSRPDVEVQSLGGGQPRPPFVIGAE